MDKYPLTWPEGWPRCTNRKPAQFGKKQNGSYGMRSLTYHDGLGRVFSELRALKVHQDDIIVSTNLKVGLSGMPKSDQREPADPGAAVYFQKDGEPMRVIAIDIYSRVADNLAAVAATLEAMRAIERHGGAQVMEKAFTGFDALPPPRSCWEILGLAPGSSRDWIDAAFKQLARKAHPDNGGSVHEMQDLNRARDEALDQIGKRGAR